MFDERWLREIADQINVPMPHKLTRGEDRGSSAAIRGRLGNLGASETQRVEAVYEQVPVAKALRRTIDLLLKRESLVLVGQAARISRHVGIWLPPVGEQLETQFEARVEAVTGKRFVLAEEHWQLRDTPALSSAGIEVPLNDLARQDPAGLDHLTRLEIWDVAVFGLAHDFARNARARASLLVAPVAIFQRSGSSPDFRWDHRRR